MISCEIVVTGKVQGVGFRRFVLSLARKYNITGYVKNRFTREVYIVATGEEFNQNIFIEKLKEGNHFSRVENVAFFTIPLENDFEGFVIR